MNNPLKSNDFEAIKLKLASPENILAWSHGEVTRPETINYRTQKPEKDGLFCERIFGPSKDWECYCGKYKKIRYKGIICDKCGVEVTRSLVRRERMGHIKLETPVTHIWFLRGLSSKVGLALDLSMQSLEKVVYFASFIITDVNEELKQATIEQIKLEYKAKKKSLDSDFNEQASRIKAEKAKMTKEGKSQLEVTDKAEQEIEALEKIRDEKMLGLDGAFSQAQKELKDLKPLTIISENIYQNLSLKYGHIFSAGIGAEAVRSLLERLDLAKEIKHLEKILVDAVESKKEKLIKRLKFFKNLKSNNVNPAWMVMKVVPVIPPDLRPMVALDGGRFATSDLNDLYRRIINRNNRLKQLLELNAPEVICRNEKRMLQEAVDALIDNSIRHGKTVVASTGQKRMLKSLADSLKGKQGRFRQNLLGKRIDYSGRSVIVVNPNLRLDQCGLPKRMAIELFKPFIISKLIQREIVHNVRSASRYIEAGHDEVWDILEEIIEGAYVLLNRAPTLHRLGIQAFRPILIEGLALQIHPLVCTAFNADFDGDQMAVHVPLTEEAIAEARDLMLASHNLLKPATGDPVVAPDKDIVWGAFYMTSLEEENTKAVRNFYSPLEAKAAYQLGGIRLRENINVMFEGTGMLTTTVGRIIFNDVLPEGLRYVNELVGKGKVKGMIKECYRQYGETRTVQLLDEMKKECFAYITRSGLSWGMGDLPDFKNVHELIATAEGKAEEIMNYYDDGLLTESERYSKTIELWTKVKEEVTLICTTSLDKNGPVFSMIESGARGSWAQLTQILGMKGLVTSPSGKIIELPVKGNFKKGFDVLEYFIATHGVRKGLSDTALRTSNAGYLTRRLVDVAQDVVIMDEDCGSDAGITMTKEESDEMGRPLLRRIVGRFLAADLKNAEGKVLLKNGELVSEDLGDTFVNEDLPVATVRSILHCKLHRGVCQKCYGFDLAYNKLVKLGTAVGIIAAQSIGEPGTQLTMRTFHTGGVADQDDITQGLPRVEEIFEARSPKRKAFIAEVGGKVMVTELRAEGNNQNRLVSIMHEGEEIDKYYFAEATLAEKNAHAEKADKDEKGVKKKKSKVEVLVKDQEKVKEGTQLFRAGEVVITAARAGVVKTEEKYIKVVALVEKAKEYIIPRTFNVWVKDGETVEAGQQLSDGSLDLQHLYELRGLAETQKYIVKEIQYVYSSQGQPLNDKHIETIARQMFSRIYIQDSGETSFLVGEIIEKSVFDRQNDIVEKAGKKIASGRQLLMGMTKASLTTNSFLSAASFQETAKVLIDAAITGKIDYLEGLKENVIIGRPIPAGTGFKQAIKE
ncbi:MAG TPA: DNA-directed RNA polymerase subunit beta' [bacterium]|nr:DNA-directed RNA polymerase subunit beta' [bacterium]